MFSRYMAALATVVVGLALGATPAPSWAKDKKPNFATAETPDAVKPGKVTLLTAPKGMQYFLKIPKGYDAKAGAPLLVFMHGSNGNGMHYLPMFGAKRWYHDAIIACPNGDRGSDPVGANNFTFDAAPLVADLTVQIQEALNVTHTYIGGHSQGGFVTYSVIMNFPALYDGALPMAGDCWIQNEPHLWEDQPDVLAQQMSIPIAIVHGQADTVVQFAQGQHAFDVFKVMGYPKLRLFAPEHLGHQFGLSPVGDCLVWLDAMNGLNPKAGLKAAAKWAKSGEWASVHAAGRAFLARGGLSSAHKAKAAGYVAQAEAAAAKAVPAMEKLLADETDPRKWLRPWWEFRRLHGATDAAKPLIDAYVAKREEQRALGRSLGDQAERAWRSDDPEKALSLMEQILAEAPYSYNAYYAVRSLDRRDEDKKKKR